MTRILLYGVTLAAFFSAHAQKDDSALREKLAPLLRGFNGDAGIYVQHMKSGKTVAINADTVFPMASMVKVPITIGMFEKIERGEIPYDSVLTYRDSLLYEGEDILVSFREGERIAHGDYVFCLITKNQKDERFIYDNEGSKLLRDASRIIWRHFEPDSKWKPAKNIEEWYQQQ